jgi:hypothetical protein
MSEARVPASVADLKFLHGAPQHRPGNFKSIGGTAFGLFADFLLPKFAQEGAAHGCELRK